MVHLSPAAGNDSTVLEAAQVLLHNVDVSGTNPLTEEVVLSAKDLKQFLLAPLTDIKKEEATTITVTA